MPDAFPASVCLVSVDPATNRDRLYRLTWQTTLWGEGVLVCWWGRRGSNGRSQLSFYPDDQSTQAEFQRPLRLRLRHGYRPLSEELSAPCVPAGPHEPMRGETPAQPS